MSSNQGMMPIAGGVPIELNVYDLQHPDNPDAVPAINWYLHGVGLGLYHSGVSIYGTDYCYGGHADDDTGVFEVVPPKAPDAKFRQTVFVGRTSLDPQQVSELVKAMAHVWSGNSCNVLTRAAVVARWEVAIMSKLLQVARASDTGENTHLAIKIIKNNPLSSTACSDVNIAHCDLKPENVLLRHPQRSAIKAVDFDASCRISQSMSTYVQSRFYRAPEVILGKLYGTQVDVWSLGCMLIELHKGYPLFAGKDKAHQMAIIAEGLGMPLEEMLLAGPKTSLLFEQDSVTGRWRMRPEACPSGEAVIPGSKSTAGFVDIDMGASNGRRKRVSGGHLDVDYSMFLGLVDKMLRYSG
ncbi:Possible serine/threonine protein kinase [Chondrus crispus]|uniref:Possible serine/threonine protein kinase n=1 Tax=Chondrus crispus TaxID=2769 RepID=R7QT36_CHOCR|nr:Possible serine/threonine protein kinase [Chondrus crispus]CDF41299.1 Possible serine/threonine protein kinase [Chondrus crispus]|eukprot:XP_005711593.1 Possible serine/threonine protein kinase [Chondrus crispus]